MQEVLKARQKRADLARVNEQIVRIQASIRMFLARRRYHCLRNATVYGPSCVLLRLIMLRFFTVSLLANHCLYISTCMMMHHRA